MVTTAKTTAITGMYLASQQSAVLTVEAPIASFACRPNPIWHGSKTQGVILLKHPACRVGGVVIRLSSSDSQVATLPASVTVKEGDVSIAFPVSTLPGNFAPSVTLTAQCAATQSTAILQLLTKYVTTDLGTLGGPASEARAIDNGGHVVGWADVSREHRHAFIFNQGKHSMEDLGTLGHVSGGQTENSQGFAVAVPPPPYLQGYPAMVVGDAFGSDPYTTRGFLWASWNGIHPLYNDANILNDYRAFGINSHTQVVGSQDVANIEETVTTS